MKSDDVALIQRVLSGDDDAFSELVEKYQKQVHALAWRKIGDFHIAEEITQDTFLKAYKRLTILKEPQRFASWLYVIAANRCTSWLRKKRICTQSLEHLDQTDTEQLEKEAYSEFVVEENERISGQEQREVVKKLLAKLGESERTVMTLHYFGEMSCSEIGAFLGVSANTVKSRLRRAQQRLQKEEPMIREALDHFQITPHLTENIMREISRVKSAAPTSSKPFVPWVVAASTLTVVLLILGFGNSNFLTRFQKPYSFDATAEIAVEVIDTPIVANLEFKPDLQMQIRTFKAPDKQKNPEHIPDNASAATAEAQANEIADDYTKWELPKAAKARLGKGGINALQFSPDGKQLAIGSDIGVWLYDVKTRKEVSMFPGICQSLAFSPDGRFIANGGNFRNGGRFSEKKLQIWDITNGRKITLTDVLPSASVLSFSEDGKTLVSLNTSRDAIIRYEFETDRKTELKTGKQIGVGIGKSEVYALSHDKLAIGGKDGNIEIWGTNTGEKLFSLHEKYTSKRVFSLVFSPDGTFLASGSEDSYVRLWDLTSSKEPIILRKHSGWVNALAFSPDGEIIASGSTDKTVVLWNASTGERLTTLTGHINGVAALAFSPDGALLVSGSTDGTIKFWDIVSGKLVPNHITGHIEWVKTLAFINDSNTLASVAFNGIITRWNLKTRHLTDIQKNRHHDLLYIAAFSHDGTQLVSTGSEGTIVFTRSGRFVGNTVSDSLISLTEVETGRYLTGLKTDGGPFAVAFSPNGNKVAFNSYGNVRVWNTETGFCLNIALSEKWQLDHNGDVIVPADFNPDDVPKFPIICALAFSPDGKMVVSGTTDGKIQMWDAEKGVALSSFSEVETKREPITALSFTSDGKLLAVGSKTRFRVMGSNKLTRLKEVNHGVATLLFAPESTLLVCGLANGRIEVWDIADGEKLITVDGHAEIVTTLVFSPDGKTLVSTGRDGTILVWDWDEVLEESAGE